MIIAGAGSAGKETCGVYTKDNILTDVIFYDENITSDIYIYNKYKVVNEVEELKALIIQNPDFCVAIGNPRLRKKMFAKLIALGGQAKDICWGKLQTISDRVENATIYQPGVVISYDVKIGKSCMLHANTTIGHKVTIGDFVNLGPLCSIIGPCNIGNETYIGAGSIILPNISVGNNVFVSPGSIVNRDLKDFETF